MSAVLAIDGGTPVRSAPMPMWPAPGDAEVAAVEGVVRSGRINYWTGEEGRSLEREYAELTGHAHALGVANGTLALELGLRALCVGPGDEVVVPARTFIATAGAVVATGATPVVCDIDSDAGLMTAETVERVLSPRTRAVIPVHVGGWPVDMSPLLDLARDRRILVLEDCAQAHGATYRGRPVGALGHAAAFSFCQDKIVPAGEGGLLLLDDDEAFERAWSYRDHGKSRQKSLTAAQSPGSAYQWLVDDFGTNWRLDELSAALGRAGLRLLPEWHAARTLNAARLAQALARVPGLRVPLPPSEVEHAFYRLYALVELDALAPGWDRDRIVSAVIAEGTPVQYGTCAEIYREEAFRRAGLAPAERLPGAAAFHESSLAFFIHPTLGEADIDDTAAAIAKVMEVATS